jgi:hypothetical protein
VTLHSLDECYQQLVFKILLPVYCNSQNCDIVATEHWRFHEDEKMRKEKVQ